MLGGDSLILNSKNESYISYADLTLAIIDELKNKNLYKNASQQLANEHKNYRFDIAGTKSRLVKSKLKINCF